jgi:hypothetical protein
MLINSIEAEQSTIERQYSLEFIGSEHPRYQFIIFLVNICLMPLLRILNTTFF